MFGVLLLDESARSDPKICDALRWHGYEVHEATSLRVARDMVQADPPDLILVHLASDRAARSIEVCRQVRRLCGSSDVAVVAMAGLVESRTEAELFEAGADVVIRGAALNAEEVLPRVLACLRRRQSAQSDVLQVGSLQLLLVSRQAFVGRERIALRPKEFEVLAVLVRHAGETMSRDQLLGRPAQEDRQTAINVHILKIRRALGPLQRVIETVRGEGYRLNMAAKSNRRGRP